jgi:hypothetical protein
VRSEGKPAPGYTIYEKTGRTMHFRQSISSFIAGANHLRSTQDGHPLFVAAEGGGPTP